jgi:hydroxymethylglutaryl-CoA lyase
MGFGNPYGDEWSPEVAINWVKKLASMGIKIISISDTVGVGNPETISYLFKNLIPAFPEIEFGAHLHTHSFNWEEKVKAAQDNGCKRFDGAMKGYGGCPMAADDLVGNMPTENLIKYFKKDLKNINYDALDIVNKVVDKVFLSH